MATSDTNLLARIAEGDREAFSELYDRYGGRVFGLASAMLRNEAEAEDVLQETFWQVWSRAAQFDAGRGSPLAWLILIARSRCLDHLRRDDKRRATTPLEFDEPASHNDLGDALDRDETTSRARRAIAGLPEDQRIAIQLAFFGGLTHQEISELHNTALGTVKTRIRLGMRKIRELVQPGDAVACPDDELPAL